MNMLILIAALAAEEKAAQFERVVTLEGAEIPVASASDKALAHRQPAVIPAPEGTPLIAVRQPDGSLLLRHEAQPAEVAQDEQEAPQ